VTTQDQDDGPTYDGRFRGVRRGSNRAGMFTMVAEGSVSNAISGAGCDARDVQVPQGNLQQGKGYNETSCKILKQIADSFHNKCRRLEKAICRLFLSVIYRHRKHMSIGLSGRGAKFFLDRGKQSSYHDHKFSGAFPARAKFHLRAKGKVVNCCSHSWEGANGPVADYDGTRFRKAETGRPNQANESIPRLRSLREDRPVGFNPFPAHMEEGDTERVLYNRVAGRWKEGRVY